MLLREQIEALARRETNEFSREDRIVFDEFKQALNRGEVRAAEKHVKVVGICVVVP